ncbi:MAG: hypothetical protein ABGW87_07635 [Sphingomonadaceae bacterium]
MPEEEPENGEDPKQKKSKNRARDIAKNIVRLSKVVLHAAPKSFTEVRAIPKALYGEIWGSNMSAAELEAHLFAFGPWEDLKMAVLDARCHPLPDHLLPCSREELVDLCRSLFDRTDSNLQSIFMEGWGLGATGREDEELSAFCSELWATREQSPDFFRAVVTGRHGAAVACLRAPSWDGMPPTSAINLIFRMALIWCAHDVQATAARAYRSTRGAFGWLHSGQAGEGERMTAGTPIAVWRPAYKMLTENVGRYRTNEEVRNGKPEGKATRHDDVKTIWAEAKQHITKNEPRGGSRADRDDMINEVRQQAENQDDLFWNEIRKDRTSEEVVNQQMSQIWYHGLTPLQVASVATIGLVHMEAVLKQRIIEMYESPSKDIKVAPPSLAFQLNEMPTGWPARARLIVDGLRRAIIQDSDLDSKSDHQHEEDGAPANDDTYLDPAAAFMGQFWPEPNDQGRIVGPLRSYKLLKNCAVTRLKR